MFITYSHVRCSLAARDSRLICPIYRSLFLIVCVNCEPGLFWNSVKRKYSTHGHDHSRSAKQLTKRINAADGWTGYCMTSTHIQTHALYVWFRQMHAWIRATELVKFAYCLWLALSHFALNAGRLLCRHSENEDYDAGRHAKREYHERTHLVGALAKARRVARLDLCPCPFAVMFVFVGSSDEH